MFRFLSRPHLYTATAISSTSTSTNWDHLLNELNTSAMRKNHKLFNDTMKSIEEDLALSISKSTTTSTSSSIISSSSSSSSSSSPFHHHFLDSANINTHEPPPLAVCPLSPSQVAEIFGCLAQLVHCRISYNAVNFILWSACCTCDRMTSEEASIVLRCLDYRNDMFHDALVLTLCEVVAKDLNSNNNKNNDSSHFYSSSGEEPDENNNIDELSTRSFTTSSKSNKTTSVVSRAEQLCALLQFIAKFNLHKTENFLPPNLLEDICSELARLATANSPTILPVRTHFLIFRLSTSNLPHAPLIPVLQKAMLQTIPGQENLGMLVMILKYHIYHGEAKRVGLHFLPAILRATMKRFDELVFGGSSQNNETAGGGKEGFTLLTGSLTREASRFFNAVYEIVTSLEKEGSAAPREVEAFKEMMKQMFLKYDEWLVNSVWKEAKTMMHFCAKNEKKFAEILGHDELQLQQRGENQTEGESSSKKSNAEAILAQLEAVDGSEDDISLLTFKNEEKEAALLRKKQKEQEDAEYEAEQQEIEDRKRMESKMQGFSASSPSSPISSSSVESKIINRYFSSCASFKNADVNSLIGVITSVTMLLDTSALDASKRRSMRGRNGNNFHDSDNNYVKDDTDEQQQKKDVTDSSLSNNSIVEEEPEEALAMVKMSTTASGNDNDNDGGQSSMLVSKTMIERHYKLYCSLLVATTLFMLRAAETPQAFHNSKLVKTKFRKVTHRLFTFGLALSGNKREQHDFSWVVLSSGALGKLKEVPPHQNNSENNDEHEHEPTTQVLAENFFKNQFVRLMRVIAKEQEGSGIEVFSDVRTKSTSVILKNFCSECLSSDNNYYNSRNDRRYQHHHHHHQKYHKNQTSDHTASRNRNFSSHQNLNKNQHNRDNHRSSSSSSSSSKQRSGHNYYQRSNNHHHSKKPHRSTALKKENSRDEWDDVGSEWKKSKTKTDQLTLEDL